jgi:protein-tyrosine phosphatase
MIDLHSHVLPCLDDGAESLAESLEMLRMAAESGTTDIAATPHASDAYPFDPAKVEQRLAELRQAAGVAPRLHYGCEMRLTPENIAAAMQAPEQYTIARRGYLLLELSDFQIPHNAVDIFGQILNAGMRPVIAHPERNPLVQSDYRRLEEWVELGCVLQLTAQSLLGRFGKSAGASAHQLVKRRLAHLVASDAHRVKHRAPLLQEACALVARQYGASTAELLFTANPRRILNGRPVENGLPAKWGRRFRLPAIFRGV